MIEKILSIIIPVFNEEKHLDKFINCIQKCARDDIEFIFVNDGSSDNSEAIINRYIKLDKRIKLFSIHNSGVSSARNKGLDVANGIWVFFADADDLIVFDNFDYLITLLEKTDLSIIQCNIINCKSNNGIYKIKSNQIKEFCLNRNSHLNEGYSKSIVDSAHGSCGKFFRMSLLRTHKIKFDPKLKVGEDIKFYIQALDNCKEILATDIPVYDICINMDSSTRRYNPQLENSAILFASWLEQYSRNAELINDVAYQIFNHIKCVVITKYSYPENKNSLKNRKRQLQNVIEKNTSLQHSITLCYLNKNKLTFTRSERVTLFLLKHNFYYLLLLLKRIGVKRYRRQIGKGL